MHMILGYFKIYAVNFTFNLVQSWLYFVGKPKCIISTQYYTISNMITSRDILRVFKLQLLLPVFYT